MSEDDEARAASISQHEKFFVRLRFQLYKLDSSRFLRFAKLSSPHKTSLLPTLVQFVLVAGFRIARFFTPDYKLWLTSAFKFESLLVQTFSFSRHHFRV